MPAPGAAPAFGPPMLYIPSLPPPGQETFKGLRYLRRAAWAAAATNPMILFAGVAASVLVGAGPGVGPQFFQAFLAMVLLGGVAATLGVATVGFAVVGATGVHKGRHEFGPDHAATVVKGGNTIAVAIVLQVVAGLGGVLVVLVLAGVAFPGGRNLGGVAFSAAVNFVAVVCYGVGMQRLLGRLPTQEGRDLQAPFLIVAASGGALAVAAVVMNAMAGARAPTLEAFYVQGAAVAASVLSLAIYHRQLRLAERGAGNMIGSGAFDPDAAPAWGQAEPKPA